ncbi:LuxR family transcriptional regulator [Mycobacterium intermedium]|uniref:LuxR family transcriptional regulator n=1 Tax=Mycobacterium intermedium TaxID=28445 RepID=A0A1E3SAP2_MYCIE|nr:LuxR family transcriptional regulator [Mycobacterium intermedium]MCV6967732.1 LuxR family transcriptional regulator [Mycobacterium intermedium]ODQ99121.1 transcriptional regulator [Mycobacterium intermedium]ORB05519.1 LuxR family transcriptional regulator [Mycobacterium intermedium]
MSPHTEISPLNWSELGLTELLPTGTVTLLLADVEGSTRLWETQPEQMAAALAQLNQAVNRSIAAHDGVRPVEQGEGDSFVAAFPRASDAVACALELQQAHLDPIQIRIGVHTGEIQLRDESNYAGPTINRTARIRDLAHGGQTVLSGATEAMVLDRLPDDVWLIELGSYALRGVPRPERVVQLCHPEPRNEFPPLRVKQTMASHNLPTQLTIFVGRQSEMTEVCQLVTDNRLVTLTGAGGAGKTRLAIEVASRLTTEFGDGIWYVDLAPITNPAVAPVTVARTLGLPDQPGRSAMEVLMSFFGEKKLLLVLDNCEHLLDACGSMVVELLAASPQLTVLTTSREPLGVPGELCWRVPSLPLADEAIELFRDRARRVRTDFVVGEHNYAQIAEICTRLDGMPLAIELAAARVRSLSLHQIVDSLHDRFRLLTGGARTAVRRQQTLRASVDWSHALLTEPERVLFRRLAVFAGGFDFDAAQAVGAADDAESYQLLDQLGLLVDKSLVVTDDSGTEMRYRMLETVRQYAQEKLGESGEADEVRTRHRDFYVNAAVDLASQQEAGAERLMAWADTEIDNLRAAFSWSTENGEVDTALRLVSSLQTFWLARGRFSEGLTGFDAVLSDARPRGDVAPAVWIQAVADQSVLSMWMVAPVDLERARAALDLARQLDNPALICRALVGCATATIYFADLARPYFAEAIELTRATGDRWNLCQILAYQTTMAYYAGEPLLALAAAEEGRDIADSLGYWQISRMSRVWLGSLLAMRGDLADAIGVLRSVAEETKDNGDPPVSAISQVALSVTLAYGGEVVGAQEAVQAGFGAANAMGLYQDGIYGGLMWANLAAGDAMAARHAGEMAWQHTIPLRQVYVRGLMPMAEALLACGDLVAARQWADETVAAGLPGWYQVSALTARAYVALAQGEADQAERDAHEALAIAGRTHAYLRVPDALECLARVEADGGNRSYVTRLLGAADAIRERTGETRFPVHQAGYQEAIAALREFLRQPEFEAMWAEGAALSTEEAIAYAQRGRGERKRPASGWGSLTPMERDVAQLVREGLSNKDIGARLFISPRTVQTHLTHVYAKLGITSRVQLVQEALSPRADANLYFHGG